MAPDGIQLVQSVGENAQVVHPVPLEPIVRDTLLVEMHGDIQVLKAQLAVVADHETRLRTVERRLWGTAGTFLAALLAAVATHVHNIVH